MSDSHSFRVEIKLNTLHASIPVTGDLMIVLKDGIDYI